MNVLELRLKSRHLHLRDGVTVLLPAPGMGSAPEDFYRPGKKYPVLWLLHGATGDHETFLYDEQILDALRGRQCMVVLPSGLNSDYANHMEFSNGYAFSDYFFQELMPYIQRMFPASPAPEDNTLAGYSMGGSGALMLGLHRPELFGQVAVLGASPRESAFLQPYRTLTGEQFRAMAMADPKRLPTEYGDPAGGIQLKEINMIARYPTVQAYVDSMECTWERFAERVRSGTLPKLLFCCGQEDGAYEKVERFRAYAESLGAADIRYEYLPGLDHGASPAVIRRAVELLNL